MSRSFQVALPLLLLAGCAGAEAAKLARAVVDSLPGGIPRVTSPGPTAWSDSAGARFVEEHRFSGEDGALSEIGQPQSIAVDAQGRVYVVDTKPAVIKVYAPDGALIRTIGSEGEGPGEFRIGFIASRGAFLVLHDPRLARTTVWDTSGTFLRSWRTSCCYWSDIQIDTANAVYIPSMVAGKEGEPPRGTPYVRWTLEGAVLDTIWVPFRDAEKYWTVTLKGPDGKMRMSMSTGIPLMPAQVSALHPDGGIVYGWGGDYRLVRSRTGQDTMRVMSRAWTADPVDDARRTAEVEAKIREVGEGYAEEQVRAAFKLEDVPSTLPAFMGLRVDPAGRIWVRRHAPGSTDLVLYDVFGADGAFLGPVSVSLPVPEWGMQAWTPTGLVALIEDDEGRPTVVRLRLEIRR